MAILLHSNAGKSEAINYPSTQTHPGRLRMLVSRRLYETEEATRTRRQEFRPAGSGMPEPSGMLALPFHHLLSRTQSSFHLNLWADLCALLQPKED